MEIKSKTAFQLVIDQIYNECLKFNCIYISKTNVLYFVDNYIKLLKDALLKISDEYNYDYDDRVVQTLIKSIITVYLSELDELNHRMYKSIHYFKVTRRIDELLKLALPLKFFYQQKILPQL